MDKHYCSSNYDNIKTPDYSDALLGSQTTGLEPVQRFPPSQELVSLCLCQIAPAYDMQPLTSAGSKPSRAIPWTVGITVSPGGAICVALRV